MTTKTRLKRLSELREKAITTNEAREVKISIAMNQEILLQERTKEKPSHYLMIMMNNQIGELKAKLKTISERIYVGTVDAGGVWGSQLCYLKINNKGILYFYIENIPSGWALSQVVNSKLVTIDGGQRWEAIIHPSTWDNCHQILDKMNDTLISLKTKLD